MINTPDKQEKPSPAPLTPTRVGLLLAACMLASAVGAGIVGAAWLGVAWGFKDFIRHWPWLAPQPLGGLGVFVFLSVFSFDQLRRRLREPGFATRRGLPTCWAEACAMLEHKLVNYAFMALIIGCWLVAAVGAFIWIVVMLWAVLGFGLGGHILVALLVFASYIGTAAVLPSALLYGLPRLVLAVAMRLFVLGVANSKGF